MAEDPFAAPTESRQLRLDLPVRLWKHFESTDVGLNAFLAFVLVEVARHLALVARIDLTQLRHDDLDARTPDREIRRIRVSLPKPVWAILSTVATQLDQPLETTASKLISAMDRLGYGLGRQHSPEDEWLEDERDWLEHGGSRGYVGAEDMPD